jgi:hypothetical protein
MDSWGQSSAANNQNIEEIVHDLCRAVVGVCRVKNGHIPDEAAANELVAI